jgi:hypothetical protein
VANPSTAISPTQGISQSIACNDPADVMTSAGFKISNPQAAQLIGLVPRTGQPHRWDGLFGGLANENNFSTSFELFGMCIDITP